MSTPANTNTNTPTTPDYASFIKAREGGSNKVHNDSIGVPTIGHGLAMLTRGSDGKYSINTLDGYTYHDDDKKLLESIARTLNGERDEDKEDPALSKLTSTKENYIDNAAWVINKAETLSTILSTNFQNQVNAAESYVKRKVGEDDFNELSDGAKIAAVSMAFNARSTIGDDFVKAAQDNHFAPAFYTAHTSAQNPYTVTTTTGRLL